MVVFYPLALPVLSMYIGFRRIPVGFEEGEPGDDRVLVIDTPRPSIRMPHKPAGRVRVRVRARSARLSDPAPTVGPSRSPDVPARMVQACRSPLSRCPPVTGFWLRV